MNFKLAREIYGNVWHADALTMQGLLEALAFYKNGGKFRENELKSNAFGIHTEGSVFSATELSRAELVPKGSIAVYNLDSVITKYGGYSHHGTVDIASQFKEMEAEENVIGHLFRIESGGGSANAISYLREYTAKNVRNKPMVVYSEDIMASAAMYIASDADYIFSRSENDNVGSIGTMIQFSGYKANSEDSEGVRHVRVYASQSTHKNKDFEDAINNFDIETIRKDILDPHASEFIRDMERNRPNITEEQKTGKIFKAKDVVGSLIDAIGNVDDAIAKIKELSYSNKSTNNTNTNMDLNQLKAEYPELVNEAVSKGVAQDREALVKAQESVAKYADKAPKATMAQLVSGKGITSEFLEEVSEEFQGIAFENNAEESTTEINAVQKMTETNESDKTEEQIEAEKEAAADELILEAVGLGTKKNKS